MPCEWSHSPEAYANALTNLIAMPTIWLAECWAEIQSVPPGATSTSAIDINKYDAALTTAESLSTFVLINDIWQFANHSRTCDNDFGSLWVCPFGCHAVPVDTPETDR